SRPLLLSRQPPPLQLRTLSLHDALPICTLRLSQAKRFSDTLALDEEFDAARARGNEGLMIKEPASFYKPGRRGREWLKLKKALADRKSTRLNSSHDQISYAVFCLKKKSS